MLTLVTRYVKNANLQEIKAPVKLLQKREWEKRIDKIWISQKKTLVLWKTVREALTSELVLYPVHI